MSKAKGFNSQLQCERDFLTVKISSETGRVTDDAKRKGWTRDNKKTGAELEESRAAVVASQDSMDLKPPGLSIRLQLAGIEVSLPECRLFS